MKNTLLGIDPGKTGAVAILRGTTFYGVFDTPLAQVPGKKKHYDISAMAELVKREVRNCTQGMHVLAIIEQQHAFPAQGGVGNFSAGEGYGIWRGILQALGVGVLVISPMRWRKIIFSEQDIQACMPEGASNAEVRALRKELSIKRARESVPAARSSLTRKKDDGRAEAILIALSGRRAGVNQKAKL